MIGCSTWLNVAEKKHLQMQKSTARPLAERPRPQKSQIVAPTEAQEAEHRTWIEHHGYDYISLAEAVRIWQRQLEQQRGFPLRDGEGGSESA
jgi:hypothetical protein